MIRVFVDRDTINDDSVVVRKLYKASGESVEAGALVLEYETSKTAIESCAPESGVLSIAVGEGDEIAVGALLYEVSGPADEGASASVSMPAAASRPDTAEVAPTDSGRALPVRIELSRKAQSLAHELRIDISALPLTGWITAADIRALADGGGAGAQPRAAAAASPVVDAPRNRDDPPAAVMTAHQIVKASVRKRTEARTLVRANSHGATSTIATQVPIAGRRLARPPGLFADNISDLVAFELARVLKSYPELNGFYIDEKRIGVYDEVHVGMSFDNGGNLKVLAIQNADTKTLPQIQQEFMSLLDLYESDRPIPSALLGSATVTVSDLSGTGADFMQPLVNGDQSLILGITRGRQGYALHASFDHRVSEGLRVARLLEDLGSRIESHFAAAGAVPDLRCSACDRAMADELALGHRGFLQVTLPDGGAGRLCRSCFEGF